MSYGKSGGTRFETASKLFLADALGIPVERRAQCGANDCGDLSGVVVHGNGVCVECKCRKQVNLWQWLDETERERTNSGEPLGLLIAKVPGTGLARMDRQLAAMDWGMWEEMAAVCGWTVPWESRAPWKPSRIQAFADGRIWRASKPGGSGRDAAVMTLGRWAEIAEGER